MTYARAVAHSSLAALLALYVVGAVSVPPESLLHEVQTLPLWFSIVAGFQNREVAKWLLVSQIGVLMTGFYFWGFFSAYCALVPLTLYIIAGIAG